MREANLIILENGNTRDFTSVAGIPVTSEIPSQPKPSTSPSALTQTVGSGES